MCSDFLKSLWGETETPFTQTGRPNHIKCVYWPSLNMAPNHIKCVYLPSLNMAQKMDSRSIHFLGVYNGALFRAVSTLYSNVCRLYKCLYKH